MEIVSPFAVAYQGNDADRHVVDAQVLGVSILGASKLYTAVAHYSAFGLIPHGNYKKQFRCYARAPKAGSYEWMVYVATVSQEYNLHQEIYRAAISYIFSKVADAVKNIWTKKGDTVKVVEALAQTMVRQAEIDAGLKEQLINGLVKSNDNLASLQGKLIDALPELADATRAHGRLLVAPVGNSCKSIVQVFGHDNKIVIDEPEAEVIRGDSKLEVEDMQNFECKEITEVNVTTGHCILNVEGFDKPIAGKISDPALNVPNNVYTRALNNKSRFRVSAKPVKRDGVVHKLYISDARDA